jgi:class 3 adenylate cyclase
MASIPPEAFASRVAVVLVADLEGYARAFKTRTDSEVVSFLDRYYSIADETISAGGGRVVKFIGDAVLAVFPESAATRAVSAAVTLRQDVERAGAGMRMPVRVGVSVHMGPVIETELGSGSSRRGDVIGRTVNQTFLLGRGSGLRISEPVYRKLPSGERTPWTKNRPPAVYVLEEGGDILGGLGKTPSENAARW